MATPVMIPCEKCLGEGRVPGMFPAVRAVRAPDPQYEECPVCHGEKMLVKPGTAG
jgi:hypothetical protein